MASYVPVSRSTIPISFQADRRHWTWKECAEAVEAVRDNLRGMLNDLNSANPYILEQGFSRYLGISMTQSPGWRHFTDKIAIPLRQVLEWEWIYRTEILDCANTGITKLSNQPLLPRTNTLYICFHCAPASQTLASAMFQQKSIQISTDWLTNEEVSRDILSKLAHRLELGERIEPIRTTLTPVLLHECLHIAHQSIIDVHLPIALLPRDVQRDLTQEWNDRGYLKCYGEYGCRILPDLERKKFSHACDGRDHDLTLSYEMLPMRNSEKISKAITIMWLSQQLPEFDFFLDSNIGDMRIMKSKR